MGRRVRGQPHPRAKTTNEIDEAKGRNPAENINTQREFEVDVSCGMSGD